ncbi:uncharacterized protein GGS22DRAFT_150970 [Annulohypoxylon maeteangense]|uniref:uncharacterized protein n=1 Tax=Annulohypoxylon maeteangense TaxID=1927788 RepID=UPI002007C4D6|nr:uncharacterized protein GGS22DRAFT_150970 [Annulohypoxylon maeteangense]KAI0890462.1 hypothetical protein GGS22DRAFT_150970 [Annulohypoxylon maeteangense]
MSTAANGQQAEMAAKGDADDALRRRRERGRRSQAGFRKRQAESNQHMRDQNRQLKAAIEKLINTTRGDEHPELLNTIFEVAEAAGIDARRPTDGENVQRWPKHAKYRNRQPSASDAGGEVDITIDPTTRDIAPQEDDQGYANFNPSTTSPSFSSQRLRCGIWLDHQHYMRISIPPDDILPFLGPRSKTLAGILFWDLMDHTQNKCKRPHSDDATAIRRGLGHSKVTEDWAVSYIQAMVEARQEYRRTGSISPQYASAAERDLGTMVRDRITAEYYAQGKDPNQWLSTLGIEKRVRAMIGDEAFARLEAAAKGEGDPALRYFFENIECKLHETCICFGDGPRWSVDVVDGIFLNWVHSAIWSPT